jgi:photosystem II stability/assembly factor-like uncharacterized protein
VGVDSLAIDPQTAGTLVAVTAGNTGVFKSTDHGSSWFLANSGLPPDIGLEPDVGMPVAIPGLVADPQDTGTLYALDVFGGRLFRSRDDGGSWLPISFMTSSGRVGPLAIAPSQPNVIYTGITSCAGSCENTIARSTDGGQTWTESRTALVGVRVVGGETGCCGVITSIAIDSHNPNIVYAGIGDDGGGEGGLWKSTDAGVSWVSLTSPFPPAPATTPAIFYITVDPQTSNTIYVTGPGFLKSVDGGQTWVTLPFGPVGPLVIDPQNSATLYGAGADAKSGYALFRSTDAGASWTAVGPGLRGRLNSLTSDPQDPETLYAGTSAGLFVISLRPAVPRRPHR